MVQLNSQHRIIAAAMTVCNELATRYKCDRVSIGWIKNGYVKVTAISHTDHFEKKMNIIEKLEIAMEEARDQDAEIIYPSQSETSAVITRDHEIYAQAQDIKFIATLPLRKKDEVVALILLERNHTPFSDTEIRQLRVSIDQFSTRLIELHKRDRWFGARIASWFRDGFGALLGYEHTWAKIFAISTCIILAIVSFVPVQYRVSSPVILRTDDISYLTAPFDGYIDSAGCNPGELVDSGAVILTLDNQDLLLEQAALIAERDREQREIEKARAAQELADMCISQARMDQVTAKLQINNYRLGQAAIHSPFDGIIIEGDLKERLGSPVKQGEILFKTGRLKDIFAEAKVHEAEIQNIFSGSKGQIALSSRPQEHFNIKVKLIEPSATISENKNVYLVRCTLADTMPRWFRPGMTGISKINAGKKTILWIISHRTIDFLRLKLWW
jgi:multidrug resistance efflux pump